MPEDIVIETRDLRKHYGAVEALRGLDLRVPSGSIYGFLGRNGAGKTTTLKVLLGMAHPTAGAARVFGMSVDDATASVAIRGRAAFVSDDKDLYEMMTVGEHIRFTAAFYSTWRPDVEQRYLQRFGLPLDRRVKLLSRGMRTQLALLLALSRGAELLLLDEPTAGLDPAAAEEVLQAIVSHAADERRTVFFSSHHIPEVEQIADHVCIIDRGRSVIAGAIDDFRQRFRRIQLVFDGDAPAVTFRARGVERVKRRGRALTVLSSTGPDEIVAEARAFGATSIDVLPVTLKDIFLESVVEGD